MKAGRPVEVAWEYESDADCCALPDDTQRLRVEIHDGGGGAYAVLITKRWAVEPQDLRDLAARIEAAVTAHDDAETAA